MDKVDIDEHISIEIHESDNAEQSVSQSEEQEIPRNSPSEPISTLCSSMRRQIISRAFYGWLAHCRYISKCYYHFLGYVAVVDSFTFLNDNVSNDKNNYIQ